MFVRAMSIGKIVVTLFAVMMTAISIVAVTEQVNMSPSRMIVGFQAMMMMPKTHRRLIGKQSGDEHQTYDSSDHGLRILPMPEN